MARKKRTWVGIAVSLLCLYLVFHSLDAEALADALRQTNFLYVVPALGVYFLGVWLRSLRWRLLLGPALRARVAMPVAPDNPSAASLHPGASSRSPADAIHPAPTTPPPTSRLCRRP